jgi:hypothetical protein
MRLRFRALLTLLCCGVAALSLTHGQDPRTPPPLPPMALSPPPALPAAATAPDQSKLTETQKQAWIVAQRGALWLHNMNAPTGRFHYGFLPALNRPLEGDNYLFQAAAAATLARAARLTGNHDFEARAAQAILLLCEDTIADPKDAKVRYTALPSIAMNRLATAGLLVSAIHELPSPQVDLLEKSDQLCNFIRRQARDDGSLCTSDLDDDGKPLKESPAAMNECPGVALHGLMLSQRQRPAAWKTDVVRKAAAYYRPVWQANKNTAFIPAQTAAYTEAYLLTKEPAFAAFVLEMNDWLCALQYETPRVDWWFGGFKVWKDGREVEDAPTVACAAYAESLANACRVAYESADFDRRKRYGVAVERSSLFLAMLQYTVVNTRHFDTAYCERLCGGFYASQQDGNLRLDYTQQAVAALLQYVEQVR